ncbi:Elongation factor Ts, mitochondrial [Labeo rohita]|uniref:Elongation factor Ts, mitochondrial n=1 Tax=Labeo rohita TaxID=84645 RepID=A0ABQ8KZY2_LABRO|nr:Elongation factor Ts, mitochondrial [Labeo rohita]
MERVHGNRRLSDCDERLHTALSKRELPKLKQILYSFFLWFFVFHDILDAPKSILPAYSRGLGWSKVKESIGIIQSVKKLRDSRLILYCKDSRQQKAALGIKLISGQKVICSIPEEKKWVKGVITGIPTDVAVEQIKKSLTGAAVIDVKRLKYIRNKEKVDSLSVMIHFDGDKLPDKVFLGFISYSVRPYVPPLLRCFKWQKYGHVAAVCREEHNAGYGGYKVRKHVAQVQTVRVEEGLSYSEALKKVGKTPEQEEYRKGWRTPVLESRNPAEFSSNPN